MRVPQKWMRKCLQADALDHKQIDLLKCKLLRTYHKTQPIKRQISTILAASVQTCWRWEILTCEHFNEWSLPSTHLFMFHKYGILDDTKIWWKNRKADPCLT